MKSPSISSFPKIENNQTFYQLACIQNVAKSIPTVILGKLLLDTYGVGTAVCSICIGNLILWLIGLTIVSMVYEAKTNAIQNIREYLGKYGGMAFAFILVLSFLSWYVNQINASLTALKTIPQFKFLWESGFDIRVGAVLGLVPAILGTGGIKPLKRVTLFTFPFFAAYLIFVMFTSKISADFSGNWGLSFPAIIMVVLLNLPATINLPTFFRHSRSKTDSFLALSIMTIFFSFFECASMWIEFPSAINFSNPESSSFFSLSQAIPFTLFILVTSVSVNMLNIYLASACYESFIPKFEGSKGYAIMGLLGTAAYTFTQISTPINFSIDLLNNFIGITGIVLLISVVLRLVIKHRPRKYERSLNFSAWLTGCLVSTILEIKYPEQNIHSLYYGICFCILFFLGAFFIEETSWAIKKLKKANPRM